MKEGFITELHQANERAEGRVAGALRHQLSVTQDLARSQEALERLQVFTNSAGFRIVAKVTRSASKYPRAYWMFRGVVRSVAGKPRE